MVQKVVVMELSNLVQPSPSLSQRYQDPPVNKSRFIREDDYFSSNSNSNEVFYFCIFILDFLFIVLNQSVFCVYCLLHLRDNGLLSDLMLKIAIPQYALKTTPPILKEADWLYISSQKTLSTIRV